MRAELVGCSHYPGLTCLNKSLGSAKRTSSKCEGEVAVEVRNQENIL